MAKADGHVHEDELAFLYKVGRKYGLKDRQIAKIIEDQTEWVPYMPDSHRERVGVLYDLVGMMLADGVIEDSEMDFIKSMTDQFDYHQKIIQPMINLCRKEVKDAFEWEDFLEEVKIYRKATESAD